VALNPPAVNKERALRLSIRAISDLKKRYPSLLIMAGNVCTSEGVQFLIDCGADCIKVGVGNGSICSTRMKTGCGVPQLSALMDCFSVAKKANIPIVGPTGPGNLGKFHRDGDRSLQLLVFNEECLVSASHQHALTTSLPFLQAFIATAVFGTSMSAHPILGLEKAPRLPLFAG